MMHRSLLRSRALNTSARRAFSSITIDLPKVETHNLDASLFPKTTTTNKEELMKYFTEMAEMRRVEVVCDNLYKAKFIRGFCHLYDGQEAITSGMEAALTWEDAIITAYRDHTTAMGRGDNAYAVIAEMMQKSTGSSKGKGGSMHYYNAKNRFFGGNGIVGAQVPVGAGIAFAMKYKNLPNVTVAMYGDGAANQGQIFEAANMAALWKLPCIFLCENNKYGMGTSNERAAHNTKYYTRGDTIPGFHTNGQNVFAVRESFKAAKKYCVEGNGPLFAELETYRYHGHSMSDPGITYRSRDEINDTRKNRDPIEYVRGVILGHKLATEKDLKDIEKKIRADIDASVEKIKTDPEPAPEELYSNVGTTTHYIRGAEYNQSKFDY